MFSRFNAIEDFTYEQMLLCDSIVLMPFFLAEMLETDLPAFPGILANGAFDRALVRLRSVRVQYRSRCSEWIFFGTQGTDAMNIFTCGARQFGRYPYFIYGKGI
ncbi:ABC-type uncharacterized transport system permease subunit [Anaerotaenia torta]|uniref:hypothetical protein n=1 Tax=Anaerotaenia torta TaxID=433293 RepID=UPI003D1EADDC